MHAAADSNDKHPSNTVVPGPEPTGIGAEAYRPDARCASIISISADAIVSIDESQRITLFNRGAEEIFGYSASEVLGKPLDILIPEAVREIHRQHVRDFGLSEVSGRRMGEPEQIMGRRKDGEIFPADASISQVVVEGQKVYTAVLRDITASVHAREALHQANAELHGLIMAAPLPLVVLDRDGLVEVWNPAAERVLGWREDEVLGNAPPDQIDELRAEFATLLVRARQGTITTGVLTERLRRDGSRLAMRLSLAPLHDVDGEFRGTILLLEDESESRSAEEAQRRLTAILEATPDLVSIADPAGRITFLNQAGREMLGLRDDAETSDRIFPQFYPEWAASILLRKALPTAIREGSWSGETAILGTDGREVPVSQVIIAHKGSSGKVEYLSTIMREITARKEAEATQQFLIEASRRLSSSIEFDQVLRGIAEVIVPKLADFCLIDLISPDNHIYRPMVLHRDTSKQALVSELRRYPPVGNQHFGVPRVIQTGVSEVVPEITEVWLRVIAHDEDHFRVMQRLQPISALIISLRVRGKVIGAVTGVYAESGRHYDTDDLRVGESLAARAALAIDNAGLYRGLQHALRTRDEVLRIVAHDLRNPLNTISLSTGILFESMPPDLAHHCGPQLEIIRRATDRANRLIGDLLDVARLEAGKLSVECHPVETVPLLEEALALQHELAEDHGLRLVSRIHGTLPSIMADRDRVLQVFGNLIGNAIKFTPEGGTITVGVERVGEMLQFSVADTGPGISEDEIAYLFDAFWQARTGTGEGTGLGLTICRGIINAHGGRIWVRSRVGGGSTFYFTLPLATEKREPTGIAGL